MRLFFKNTILLILIVLSSLLFNVGCSEGGKITANEVLDQNPDADFFQYDVIGEINKPSTK
jgi:hypothetical protein